MRSEPPAAVRSPSSHGGVTGTAAKGRHHLTGGRPRQGSIGAPIVSRSRASGGTTTLSGRGHEHRVNGIEPSWSRDSRSGPGSYAGPVDAAFFDLDKTVIAKASMVAFHKPLRRARHRARAASCSGRCGASSCTCTSAPTRSAWPGCGSPCSA